MILRLLRALLLFLPFSLSAQAGQVQVRRMTSAALGVTKHFVVYLPPSYARQPARRYPVTYYLHGRGDDETMWVSKGALDQVMDSLIQAGMPEMIVVMPDGDDSWWSDRDPVTWEPPCTDNRLSDEPAGAYCAVRALYARYVVNEMVPLVDSLYRTRRDRGSRGIAGASMGGFGALTLAFDHPDLWSATLSHIGAISLLYVGARSASGYAGSAEEIAAYWRARGRNPLPPWATAFGPDVASWQRHDPVRIVKALQAANPRQVPAIYLDAATGDTTFAEQSRIVHTELTRAGIAHSYQEFPGRHDWAFIRAQLANGLRWMADRIAR